MVGVRGGVRALISSNYDSYSVHSAVLYVGWQLRLLAQSVFMTFVGVFGSQNKGELLLRITSQQGSGGSVNL